MAWRQLAGNMAWQQSETLSAGGGGSLAHAHIAAKARAAAINMGRFGGGGIQMITVAAGAITIILKQQKHGSLRAKNMALCRIGSSAAHGAKQICGVIIGAPACCIAPWHRYGVNTAMRAAASLPRVSWHSGRRSHQQRFGGARIFGSLVRISLTPGCAAAKCAFAPAHGSSG